MRFSPRFSFPLFVALVLPGLMLLPLRADQGGRDLMRASLGGPTSQEEERDARELADRINEALNIRREVTITLLNDTSVIVSGRVSAHGYWLIITGSDNSEFRFRVSLIATVRIK